MRSTATRQNPINPGTRFLLRSPLFSLKLRLIYRSAIFLLFISSIGLSLYLKLSLIQIGITMASSLIAGFLFYQTCKKIVTGSVHGDYLIVTYRLTNKSKVVDIKHLKRMRTARFLWFRGAQFTYNLDGDIRRVLLLCNSDEISSFNRLVQDLKKAA